jgi:hypothetical protein
MIRGALCPCYGSEEESIEGRNLVKGALSSSGRELARRF